MRRILATSARRRARVGETASLEVAAPEAATAAAASSSSPAGAAASIDSAMDLIKGRNEAPPSQEVKAAARRAQDAIKAFVRETRQGLPMEARNQAAMELARFVNTSYGAQAVQFGLYLRKYRALAFVLQLLYEGEPMMQRVGLMVLSNLVSDAFDPKSAETKRQVLHANVFERIKDFVFGTDEVSQVYALACLQNLAKDVAFARLIRDHELVEELERLLAVTHNENVRKFAAGALYNTVEAIHRQAQLRSLDSMEATEAGAEEGIEESSQNPRRRSMFQEEEIELTEEVLAELGKREALARSEERLKEEAASIIQSVVRKRRTTRAFRTLQRMAHAVRIVTRFVRMWQRKRHRRAVLILQAHARAYVVHRLLICDYNTMITIIEGTRAAYLRCLCHMVYKRFALIRLEARRQEAVALFKKHDSRRRQPLTPLKRSKIGVEGATATVVVGSRIDNIESSGGGGKSRSRLNALGTRRNLVNGLVPRSVRPQLPVLRLPSFGTSNPHPLPVLPVTAPPSEPHTAADDVIEIVTEQPGAQPSDAQPPPCSCALETVEVPAEDIESRLEKAAAAKAVLDHSSVVGSPDVGGDGPNDESDAGAFMGRAMRRLYPSDQPSGQESGTKFAAFSNLGDSSRPPSAGSSSLRGSTSYAGLPSARFGTGRVIAGSSEGGAQGATRLTSSASCATLPQRSPRAAVSARPPGPVGTACGSSSSSSRKYAPSSIPSGDVLEGVGGEDDVESLFLAGIRAPASLTEC
mmetsp:Transcript_4192/g.9175  ORF Transcript_4192/g.9175 Transcript_4192/m.9175 type:complete len:753 (-) Transcript_4192:251-2509(-)